LFTDQVVSKNNLFPDQVVSPRRVQSNGNGRDGAAGERSLESALPRHTGESGGGGREGWTSWLDEVRFPLEMEWNAGIE